MSVRFVSGAIAVGGTTSRLDKDSDVVWKKTFVSQSETISFILPFFLQIFTFVPGSVDEA